MKNFNKFIFVMDVLIFSTQILCQNSTESQVLYTSDALYLIDYRGYELHFSEKTPEGSVRKVHEYLLIHQPNLMPHSNYTIISDQCVWEVSYDERVSEIILIAEGKNVTHDFLIEAYEPGIVEEALVYEEAVSMFILTRRTPVTSPNILRWLCQKPPNCYTYIFFKCKFPFKLEESKKMVQMSIVSRLIIKMAMANASGWSYTMYYSLDDVLEEVKRGQMPANITRPNKDFLLVLKYDNLLVRSKLYHVLNEEVFLLGNNIIWYRVVYEEDCKRAYFTICINFEMNITYEFKGAYCEYSLTVKKREDKDVAPCCLDIQIFMANTRYEHIQLMLPLDYLSEYAIVPRDVEYKESSPIRLSNQDDCMIVRADTNVVYCAFIVSHLILLFCY